MKIITFPGMKDKGWPYSRAHTDKLIAEKRIPITKIKLGVGPKGRVVFDESQIDEFLESRKAASELPEAA